MGSPEPQPTTFGRYRLQGRLGAGGMAEVYRAELVTSAGITKPVVIKKILKAYADDEAFKAMFLEEARIAASLTHSNIAQVVDVGEIDGELYLALEFVHGKSLAQLISRLARSGRRLPENYACLVASEMCKGLHHAHTRTDSQKRPLNLVHRDISPQNVMISFEGEVKLVDFGIAKAYGEDRPGRSKTAAGVIKGKYHYFSPEQARSRPLDGRTDIYATGVVLYEMLCGQHAFAGPMTEVLRRIVHGELKPLLTLDPGLSEEVGRITHKALAAELEARYPSAQLLQQDLAAHVNRRAPGMGPAALAGVMAVVFEDELLEEGESRVSDELRVEVGSWRKSLAEEPSSSGQTRAGRSRKVQGKGSAPGTSNPPETRAAPSQRLLVLIASGIAGLAIAGLGGLAWLRAQPAPTEAEVTHLAPPAPPPPPKKAATPTYQPRFGGKAIAGLGCDADVEGDAGLAAIKAYREGRVQADVFGELQGAQNAVANSPRAGRAYAALGEGVIDQNRPYLLAARELESFALSCPQKLPETQLALDVAGRGAGTDAPALLETMERAQSSLVIHRDPDGAAHLLDTVRRRAAGDVGFDALADRVDAEQANYKRLKAARSGGSSNVRALVAVSPTSVFYKEAAELLARHHLKASQTSPADAARATELYRQGQERVRMGDLGKATDLFKDAVEHDPSSVECLKALGTVLVRQLRFDEAAQYYRRFLKIAPDDPQAPSIRVALAQYQKLLGKH